MTRPRVTLKLATSLDGRIALANGASQWITGPEARAEVHRLRAAHDAVVTGIGTVLADDPLMSARIEGEAPDQPRRIVLDTHLKISPEAHILNDAEGGPVMVFCGGSVPVHLRDRIAAKAEVVPLNRYDGPSISLKSVLEHLAGHDVETIMIEAGGKLAGVVGGEGLGSLFAECLQVCNQYFPVGLVGGLRLGQLDQGIGQRLLPACVDGAQGCDAASEGLQLLAQLCEGLVERGQLGGYEGDLVADLVEIALHQVEKTLLLAAVEPDDSG